MKLPLSSHTILVTVGPSNCGKSYACTQKLLPQVPAHEVAYLSSDECRRELLGTPQADKMSDQMLALSKQAFNLLLAGS
jgi:hypothetical protein